MTANFSSLIIIQPPAHHPGFQLIACRHLGRKPDPHLHRFTLKHPQGIGLRRRDVFDTVPPDRALAEFQNQVQVSRVTSSFLTRPGVTWCIPPAAGPLPPAARAGSSIVGRMESGAFEDYSCAGPEQATDSSTTFGAGFHRCIGDALKLLETVTALFALVFICWHGLRPPPQSVQPTGRQVPPSPPLPWRFRPDR